MTQSIRPRRQVLASLVPIKTRSDPLQSDTIPTTDYFRSSALSLHLDEPQQHAIDSIDDTEERWRTHRDSHAMRDVDNQIRHAQHEWRQHQEERFSARLALLEQQSGATTPTTTSRPKTVTNTISIHCPPDLLLEQLNAIGKWTHR